VANRADLLKVFTIDVLACPECSGRMKLIAFVANEAVARHILDHLGLDSTGPPLMRPKATNELLEPVPDHDIADPVYPTDPGAVPPVARLALAATTLARTCSAAPLPGRTSHATIAGGGPAVRPERRQFRKRALSVLPAGDERCRRGDRVISPTARTEGATRRGAARAGRAPSLPGTFLKRDLFSIGGHYVCSKAPSASIWRR
jgi:hypothetical protein